VRFDANLSILFGDRPILDRPAAAAAAGFDAVEMWWPFADLVPTSADVDGLVRSFDEAGVDLVSMNLALGRVDAGQHGLVALPDERARFRDHLDAAIAIAGRLGAKVLNALYGNPPDGLPRGLLDDTAVENLAVAARLAAGIGATVVLEALNPVDFPRYGLHRTGQALALADRVRAETGAEVAILFDVYNVQRSEGDLLARIAAHAARFGHVQIADVPGRFRPGTGEVSFERVLPALEAAGYAGYVGLEYRPSPDPADTFSWLPIEQRRSRHAPLVPEREGGRR
jgi:hydroxypyruvate isomerase